MLRSGHLPEDFLEERRELLVEPDLAEVRVRREAVPGERLEQRRVLREHLQRRAVQGADRKLAQQPEPLELIERRQNLNLRNHPAADDGDLTRLVLGHVNSFLHADEFPKSRARRV